MGRFQLFSFIGPFHLTAGPWLPALTAVDLMAFGVFSWANARCREV
ncbi:hypothetical protein ACGF3G_48735 [Streptomyces sp. NPDC048179]